MAAHTLDILVRLLPVLLAIPMVLGPGAAVTYLKWPQQSPPTKIAKSLVLVGVFGYCIFWLYFFLPAIAPALSFLTCFVFPLAVTRSRFRRSFLKSFDDESQRVLVLCATVTIFYLGILYLWNSEHSTIALARFRFFDDLILPEDNQIPLIFARALFEGKVPTPLFGDWLSSDRPPLQTGLMLASYPVLVPLFGRDVAYQSLSTLLQCLWIPSAWCFMAALKTRPGIRTIVIGILTFTGFFYMNSVYVWPKLLGGAFTLTSGYFLLTPSLAHRERALFSAISFALALLSHGGSFFAVPLLIVLALQPKNKIFDLLKWSIPTGLALLIPWVLYQKFFDPPGNLLLKWHLAGVINIDPRSFGETVLTAYTSISFQDWLTARFANITYLFGGIPRSIEDMRQLTFYALFPSVGILWIGFFGLFRDSAFEYLKRISLGIILSLLFWIVFLFIGGTTSIHHGAYGVFIPIFLLAAMGLTRLPRALFLSLVSLHILLFLVLWI